MNDRIDFYPEDLRPGPSFQPWLDMPTLRLDEAGKRAAKRHIAEGRVRRVTRERDS